MSQEDLQEGEIENNNFYEEEGDMQMGNEDEKLDIEGEYGEEYQEEVKEEEKQIIIKDNMQRYLESEKQIIQWCKDNEKKWIDPDYSADNRALFKDPQNIPEWGREVRKITWVRPHEIVKDAKFMIDRDGDAKQGAFAESWFIGAIIIIATRGEMLEKLFVETSHFDDYGFVTFQFFKNGEWKQVTVDTLLPYDPESKQILFTYCANPSEFWIPLMEKAYSKLHGCYENICDGTILDGLVDMTGGVSEGWNLTDNETSKLIENNQLWTTMVTYFKTNFYLGCVNFVEGKGTKNADTGTHGILENHHYGICDIREFPREQLKLIRIRNPWGTDGGWNGPFCDDSEEWDKHRSLREELKLVFKSKKSDGTWWMSYNDWYVHFNKLFVCKVFPETWECYSIESRWQGKTNGGVCPTRLTYEEIQKDKEKVPDKQTDKLQQQQEKQIDPIPEFAQIDTDDKWFNNPQFRIKVTKETKMYISLMLEDKKLCKQDYTQCNFMLISNRQKNNRIWERPPNSDILNEANPKGEIPAQREITQYVTLKKFEGKNFGHYMVVPNMIEEKKKESKRTFFLRIFASEAIDVVEMPETIETSRDGQWGDDSQGGRRRFEGKNNPQWGSNPQYFLNLKQPTNLKIILQKTGVVRRTKGIRIGMTICRFDTPQNKLYQLQQNQQKPQISQQQKKKQAGSNLMRLLSQTANQLEPPVMLQIERKLQIGYGEKFKESLYIQDEVAALYFSWNPTEGPFVIIPSMEQQNKNASYKLTIFSNNPVQLIELDSNKNSVLVGKWEHDSSDGGCHLYEDPYEKEATKRTWIQNPKFILNFLEPSGPAWIKVTLALAEKNWKAKTKNTVGGMIGLYVIRKNESSKFSIEDCIQPANFLPVSVLNEEFDIQEINKNGYTIMPCTYLSKIDGTFIISVTSDQDFKLKPQ